MTKQKRNISGNYPCRIWKTIIPQGKQNYKHMKTIKSKQKTARFDTRLPKEQKMFFEEAALLGGYRSLTDFIILAAQEKAMKIISEQNLIIASQKDNEIFFNALINPPKANNNLIDAANEYNKVLLSK